MNRPVPVVMGIINCTPDSFHAASRVGRLQEAVSMGRAMVDCGAGMLDVGGESTRPGSDSVDEAEELARVVPVIEALADAVDVPISVDTRKANVARAAVAAGARIVNDVSALTADPSMIDVVVSGGVRVCLMHMRGVPKTMQKDTTYGDLLGEISGYLRERGSYCESKGVPRDRIIVDPGIGFGKSAEDNLKILKHLPKIKNVGYPVLIGLSRKSFIGKLLAREGEPAPVEGRLIGSVVANVLAAIRGADILRVHDVCETVQALRVLDGIGYSDL